VTGCVSFKGVCYPDGDDYKCQCYIAWTGRNCTEPEFIRTDDGEWDHWATATEEIQKLADENRNRVEMKTGPMSKFIAIEYTAEISQFYLNYNIKMDVGTDNHLEFAIRKSLWDRSPIVDINCPKNQEFVECGVSCPKICGKPEPNYETCSSLCKFGCQCPWSWWRNDNGSCVPSQSDCY